MKNIKKTNLLVKFLFSLALFSFNLNSQTHYSVAKLEIPKMQCEGCAKKIKLAFKNTEGTYEEGIFEIITKPSAKLVTFKFSKEAWKLSDILNKLKQTGYEANVI